MRFLNLFSNPTGPTGIDVYHGDTNRWTRSDKLPGFIFLKATEGANHVDANFKDWRAFAKEHNIPCGAYHFLRGGDVQAQIDNFMNTIGSVDVGELPCVLDWEARDAKSQADAFNWLQSVHIRTEIRPIIYSYVSFIREGNISKEFAAYPLWIAHYTAGKPTIPAPFTNYLIHQFAEGGTATTEYDQDRFNGTMEQLQAMRKA